MLVDRKQLPKLMENLGGGEAVDNSRVIAGMPIIEGQIATVWDKILNAELSATEGASLVVLRISANCVICMYSMCVYCEIVCISVFWCVPLLLNLLFSPIRTAYHSL